jgi:hypothetical protein
MITEFVYYGSKVVHRETGRVATVKDTDLFVKNGDSGPGWIQSISYFMDDKEGAVFVKSVDAFRRDFDLQVKE